MLPADKVPNKKVFLKVFQCISLYNQTPLVMPEVNTKCASLRETFSAERKKVQIQWKHIQVFILPGKQLRLDATFLLVKIVEIH